MTALMANTLVQAGALNLSSRVVDVFHYLRTAADGNSSCECRSANSSGADGYFSLSPYACITVVHPSYGTVTVAHLLTHGAGLSDLEASARRCLTSCRQWRRRLAQVWRTALAIQCPAAASSCIGSSLHAYHSRQSACTSHHWPQLSLTAPPRCWWR
jgi:CubicO group peptidase (beta-lactamase class C family)